MAGLKDIAKELWHGRPEEEKTFNIKIEEITKRFNIRGKVTYATYDYKKGILKIKVKC